MAVVLYNPTTPGRRGMTSRTIRLGKRRPDKSLTRGRKRAVGRGERGRITVRHHGGGHKRLYREIDFRQDKKDIPARVESIEYDPNRTSLIALILYRDGERRYILAPHELKHGDEIVVSERAPFSIGNRLPLKHIPVGTYVHNAEIHPGKGGQIGRSAGSSLQVMAHEGGYTHLQLPSKEIRMVPDRAYASLGILSNPDHNAVKLGKAGRSRHLGRRPSVRGSAMNPVDHPHGGGEGRQPIGLKHPKTPWGKPALGVKTRKKHRWSNRLILKRRK
ncbi:MAG: 50S ribosomal protein L2 [Parcubacteria group bacterium]|nr:50S ribosomal protein L2 [Parcubacteria group bacterium]